MSVEVRDERLTPSQAGRMLGVSAQRIRQLVAEGRLPAEHTPLGRLIRSGDVEELMKERMSVNERRHA